MSLIEDFPVYERAALWSAFILYPALFLFLRFIKKPAPAPKSALTLSLEAEKAFFVKSDRFLRHLNHEIRNPINALCGFCQVLQSLTRAPQPDIEKITEYAACAERAAEELHASLKELEAFCANETGFFKEKPPAVVKNFAAEPYKI